MDELMKYRPKARYWLPGAAVDLTAVEKDIWDMYERGFGSVEVVSFGGREKVGWGNDAWHQVLVTILRTAKRLGMKVDLANGPAWPIAMPTIKHVDDEASLYELTYGMNWLHEHQLPQPRVQHDQGQVKLVACMLYQVTGDKQLDEKSYVDLMPYLNDGQITYEGKEDGLVFAFYEQSACQQVADCYVIDHLSEKGIEACAKYWLPLYDKVLKPYEGILESLFCDSLEYRVTMEWTRDFVTYFQNHYHYDIRPYLPVVGADFTYPKNDICGYTFRDMTLTKRLQYDYLDAISQCYVNRHLKPLMQLAKKMKMKVRYQVAYNKPFELEQAAGAVDICEGEALSRVSLDNLKSMAGTVHLLGKEKYSFECSAEFGNAYGQSMVDVLWWIKRAYSAGMNDEVFHGLPYNGNFKHQYYEPFAKDISNYWNRTFDKKSMNRHLTMIARMNRLLQTKTHQIDLAIYRHDYKNNGKGGDGNHVLKDDLFLTKHGWTYDFVSYHTLSLLKTKTCFKALIIPSDTYLKDDLVDILDGLTIPIIVVGKSTLPYPQVDNYQALISYLEKQGISPYVRFLSPTTIYQQAFTDTFFFYNGNVAKLNAQMKFNPETVYPTIDCKRQFKQRKLDVILSGEGQPVIYDLWHDEMLSIPYTQIDDRHARVSLWLKADEALWLTFTKQKPQQVDIQHTKIPKKKIALDHWLVQPYQASLANDVSYFRWEDFKPLAQTEQMVFHDLSGYLVYETSFEIDQAGFYAFSCEKIVDTFTMTIDHENISCLSEYQPWVGLGYLAKGKHHLKIKVTTTPQTMMVKESASGIFGSPELLLY